MAGLLRLLPLGRKYFLYSICFLLGFSYACWTANTIQSAQLPQSWEGQTLQVLGTVEDIPEHSPQGYSLLFRVEQLLAIEDSGDAARDFKGLISLTWYQQNKEALPAIKAGERWQLKIRAKRPNGLMNPGGFDYERWLFSQRILATAYVRDASTNKRLAEPAFSSIAALREQISLSIARALGDQPSTALIQGLAVSATNGISKAQWQTLQATGTAHLLSISGLHIAMVASFGFLPVLAIWWLFPRLYLYLPARVVGGMLGALFAITYALLAGFNIPTQRSLVMVLLLMAGLLLRKQWAFTYSFAAALLVVLALDPLAPLSIGFWLSFGSVALLALLNLHPTQSIWLRFFALQFALSIFLVPVNIASFSSLPVYSPLANLVAIPWVTLLVVPLILLGIVLLPLSFELAALLWGLAAKSLDALTWGLEYLAQLPNALLYFPELPWYYLALALLAIFIMLLPRGLPGRWLGLVCLLPLVFWQPTKPLPSEFRLTVLDVGQGLATAIQTATHILVFDTGAKSPYGFDMGEVVVAPWLRSQGWPSLDLLMVSHADNDHSGGATYLLTHFPIQQVWTNAQDNFQTLPSGTTLTVCNKGQTWDWDGVHFEVLNPSLESSSTKKNNQACVLKVSNGAYSVLLSSDIEQAAEQSLVASHTDLKADVLVVPHHGSKTSSSMSFLQAVAPELAMVSSGYLNRFNHPHPKIVERYQSAQIELVNTVSTGAIELNLPREHKSLLIKKYYRKEHAKFWNRRAED
jgi:competence protein ComEC